MKTFIIESSLFLLGQIFNLTIIFIGFISPGKRVSREIHAYSARDLLRAALAMET